MAVTIKDIARRVGVSHTTVSRALRGSSLIAQDTTQRIRQAAHDMGYRPSAAARSLKTHHSQALGVIVSNIDDPFFSEILQGVENVARDSGYSLFIAESNRDPDREESIVRTMVEHRVDGVMICSTPFSPEQGRQLLKFNVPIVVVNNQAAEEYQYSIYHDDVDGSLQVTRHLISLGHRRIAYLGNACSGRTTQDRLAGYRQAMRAASLPIWDEYIYQAPGGDAETGRASTSYYLNLPVMPTAFVCFNDMIAIGLLAGLRRAGLRVPTDCSVAGFDNIIFSAFTNPPLTTFDQPKRHIGSEAARLLLGLSNPLPDDPILAQPRIQVLRGKLLLRESTAPPFPEH